METATADFGAKEPGLKLGDAQIVLAEPLDGSTKLMNTTADGKVVLVKHTPGGVPFLQKAMNVQNAGATAVIIYNNEDGPPQEMGGDDDAAAITIPVVAITQIDGTRLAAAIKEGRTTISLEGACSFSQVAVWGVPFPSICICFSNRLGANFSFCACTYLVSHFSHFNVWFLRLWGLLVLWFNHGFVV